MAMVPRPSVCGTQSEECRDFCSKMDVHWKGRSSHLRLDIEGGRHVNYLGVGAMR